MVIRHIQEHVSRKHRIIVTITIWDDNGGILKRLWMEMSVVRVEMNVALLLSKADYSSERVIK